MAGIYIHIPFCKQACNYCNFHFSTSLKQKSRLVSAICKELELRKDYLPTQPLQSIYFGGGTPSLLDPNELEQIFECISKHYSIQPDAEITLEANPDDLTRQKVKELFFTPINRLSIGIQSFFDADLTFFNRAHNAKEAIESLDNVKNVGFENITVDLIYGSPSSSMETIKRNLEIFLENEITHISCYALTVEEKTALHYSIKKGRVDGPNETETSEQYDLIMNTLRAEGFFHYEISNFARENFLAVHNTNYWKNETYLGIGPAAHSYAKSTRQWNVANNQKYMVAIENNEIPAEIETLSSNNNYNEYVMTSLRTMWGTDENIINSFGEETLKHFLKNVKKVNVEWINKKEGSWVLTQKGRHFADRIAMELFL